MKATPRRSGIGKEAAVKRATSGGNALLTKYGSDYFRAIRLRPNKYQADMKK